MKDYSDFIREKSLRAEILGIQHDVSISNHLYPFQRAAVKWALRKGRTLLAEDCGLGKTIQQLEWSKHVISHTGQPGLVLTPLAVAEQTLAEAHKFGYAARIVASADEVRDGINITNYQKLHHFDPSAFGSVVLDEGSILKSFMGKTKQLIIDSFVATPFKLICTATPAPNDHMEIGNYAEALGIMPSNEMLARWFINDPANMGHYRLRGHAETDFWKWVSSWACFMAKPSDIGFEDAGYELPPLTLTEHIVDVDATSGTQGTLFRDDKLTATSVHGELRLTAEFRAETVASLVNKNAEPWLVWCNTDYEARELMRRIPEALEVSGSMPDEKKTSRLNGFAKGEFRVLVTKPSIAGFGMNYQHCARVAFVGMSYSFEQYYQAVRRSWRFGQKREVHAHLVYAETEGDIISTVKRKQADAIRLRDSVIEVMRSEWFENERRDDLADSRGKQTVILPSWLKEKSE